MVRKIVAGVMIAAALGTGGMATASATPSHHHGVVVKGPVIKLPHLLRGPVVKLPGFSVRGPVVKFPVIKGPVIILHHK